MRENPRVPRPFLVAAIVLSASLVLAACAVNPATGKRQLVLLSESQEIEMGRQNDPAVVEQFGLYPDDDLQAYVSRLGRGIAAESERPSLDWTFRVLDDKLVNAFALPGGYIYVTRGILAHFNSEAELASVLGHEIGHVTARHSVNQMSKVQLAQLGLGVGSILAPERMEQFGNLAQTGLGLLFLKFSRDDERQADDLGLRYLVRSGYDPRPMADVFETLQRVGETGGEGRAPSWLLTHPYPENRRARISDGIAALETDFSGATVRREEYLRRLDGIVFGDDPRQGYFKDGVFYHPEMKIRVSFPEDWELDNSPSQVVGISAKKDVLVAMTLARQESASTALTAFLAQEGITRLDVWNREVNGLVAAGGAFSAEKENGALEGRVVFVEHGGHVFRLLGYAEKSGWETHRAAVEAVLASFRRLDDRRMLDVSPARLHLVRLDRSTSLDEFARSEESAVPAETLAVINGLDPGERLEAGRSYKVVRGGKLP